MKWTSVVELRRPMRTLKVEFSGRLRKPRQLRNRGIRVFPVDFKSEGLSVRSDSAVRLGKNFSKFCNTLAVSGQGGGSGFVRPAINTQRGMPRVVEVKRI